MEMMKARRRVLPTNIKIQDCACVPRITMKVTHAGVPRGTVGNVCVESSYESSPFNNAHCSFMRKMQEGMAR